MKSPTITTTDTTATNNTRVTRGYKRVAEIHGTAQSKRGMSRMTRAVINPPLSTSKQSPSLSLSSSESSELLPSKLSPPVTTTTPFHVMMLPPGTKYKTFVIIV